MRSLAVVTCLSLCSGCWYERAKPVKPAPPAEQAPAAPEDETSSYRHITIAVDALGVAAMVAGLIGLERGYDEDASGGMLVVGLTTAAFATPVIHLAHGHRGRAGGSYLVRSLAATTGTVVGVAFASRCGRNELFCGLTEMTWGVAGGLAIGGAIDAVFFHDEPSPRTWVPTMTTGDGGARVGIGTTF